MALPGWPGGGGGVCTSPRSGLKEREDQAEDTLGGAGRGFLREESLLERSLDQLLEPDEAFELPD